MSPRSTVGTESSSSATMDVLKYISSPHVLIVCSMGKFAQNKSAVEVSFKTPLTAIESTNIVISLFSTKPLHDHFHPKLYITQFALAKNEIGVVIIKSFLDQRSTKPIKCNAAVPLDTTTEYLDPIKFLNLFSNS